MKRRLHSVRVGNLERADAKRFTREQFIKNKKKNEELRRIFIKQISVDRRMINW